MIDALVAEGVEGATVLDAGGGIGAVQHELRSASGPMQTGEPYSQTVVNLGLGVK